VLTPLLAIHLQVLVAVLEHTPDSIDLVKMQEELVSAAGSQVHPLAAFASTWTAASCFCSLPTVICATRSSLIRHRSSCTTTVQHTSCHTASHARAIAALAVQVGYMIAAGTLGRLANVFSLFDQPMKDAARPVPPHVLQVRLAAEN
jgi:hypothetical protein